MRVTSGKCSDRTVAMRACLLPRSTQQRAVGGLLHQSVLERIDRIGRRAAAVHQFRATSWPRPSLSSLSGNSAMAAINSCENSADGGTDLGDLPYRRKAVEPGHQRSLQRRRN